MNARAFYILHPYEPNNSLKRPWRFLSLSGRMLLRFAKELLVKKKYKAHLFIYENFIQSGMQKIKKKNKKYNKFTKINNTHGKQAAIFTLVWVLFEFCICIYIVDICANRCGKLRKNNLKNVGLHRWCANGKITCEVNSIRGVPYTNKITEHFIDVSRVGSKTKM